MDCDEDQKTVWCGNLSDKVTEDILYELFLQAGPVRRVKIPKDKDGRQLTYAFVTFKHMESVPYALSLIQGIPLYERKLNLKPRQRQEHNHNPPDGMANQIVNNHFMVRDFSPNNRRNSHNENYNGNNRHNVMKHERRGNNRGYHNNGGRFNSPNHKPYHKNDRNRRNRH